jgi:hypothetical protein
MEAVVARKAQAAEALPVAPRPAAIPRVLAAPAFAAPVLALDSVLSLKQSWLE